ncbi:hypothetical protein ABZ208_15445 [Streptomyces sp. NPDC006208]
MHESDDDARTSARLTTFGCLAGLAVALVIPVAAFITVFFYGLPTP